MAHIKTVAIAKEYDEKGKPLKERSCYLLHWGLQTLVYWDKEGNPVPVSNTMAICEDKESGEIFLYPPSSIKIIGIERK